MIEVNKIYCESNLETMKRMPDCCIDLVVTSPPYDGLRVYNGFAFDFTHTAPELYRILKDGGVVVWVVGDQVKNGSESGSSFKQALFFMERGFRLHDTMIYRKENYAPQNHNRYEQAFEYMFVFTKGRPATFNPIKERCKEAGLTRSWSRKSSNIKEGVFRRRDEAITTNEFKNTDNIFTYTCGSSGVGHPAPFPEDLPADQIKTWSNENDIVYDPFGGSGTTAKMAHLLNRKWILSEISQEYCDIAAKRLDPYLKQHSLFKTA